MEDNKDFSVGVEPVSTPAPVKPFSPPFQANAVFNKQPEKPSESKAPALKPDKATELVEEVLHAGIVHKVQTEDGVRDRILKTADKVIDTNLSIAENKADKADKEAFFDANKDACGYFGFDEKTTSKSHVGLMRWWSWVFNTLYICTFGFFVVAPIVFFCSKLRVVVKHNWVVLALAILIYLLVVLTPFVVSWLGGV